jgi:transcriptional regulator with XRE-family HTH domain
VDAGNLLQYVRRKAGLSQRELGRRAGVTQASIARIETGQTSPRFDTLDRLLSVCGFELEPIPKRGLGIDRTIMQELLRLTPSERAHEAAQEARALEKLPRLR